ncbi:alpha/beta fold hydrolase [Oceanobacillus manasiensis]|uniref:alpha/beta fold hydrolase n=1 Tax=Oceanobacillus manasiensis TaxID=586413 RepID=UPI0005A862E6|nr:alpha/beta fold hydrolase [Oceanobacillus manasiensis]
MKKIWKNSLLVLLAILLIGAGGFYYWAQQTYDASDTLYELVNKEDILSEEDWLLFEPEEEADTGIVLYPGAKVEPEAYSYYGKQLAEQGYLVAIPNLRLNLAILDLNKAEQIMEEHPKLEHWYLAGHSLGGIGATSFAMDNQDVVKAVILLGSYPSDNTDFSDVAMPMLSIYAEHDGLSTPDKINDTKHLLSEQAVMHEIKGGNHAQFGVYGPQKGDEKALISVDEQQDEIMQVITEWLAQQEEPEN